MNFKKILNTLFAGPQRRKPYRKQLRRYIPQLDVLEDRIVPTFTLSNPGTQLGYDGDSVNMSLTAHNSSLHTLSYSAANLPAGLSVSAGTFSGGVGSAIISGTVSSNADQPNPYSVTITATDTTTNATVSQTFSWHVLPTTVTLTQPNDQINCDGDTVSLHLSATDNAHHALTYAESGLPAGLSINASTGIISGTVSSNDPLQSYSVTVTATDAGVSVSNSKTFNWTLVAIAAVLSNPGDQYNYDGDTVSLTVVAHTSYASEGIFTFGELNLPGGLTLGSSTGVISGTIADNADQGGPYAVTVSVTDNSSGLAASGAFSWTVVTRIAPLQDADGDTVYFALDAGPNGDGVGYLASNLPSDDDVAYSASNLPPGLTIDPTTGVISGTISAGDHTVSPYSVTIALTDNTDPTASGSDQLKWIVAATGTVTIGLTQPANQSNSEEDSVSLPVSATDSAGNALIYSADGLPPGLTIDPTSGTISGAVSDSDSSQGPYTVTITATDNTSPLIGASASFQWATLPLVSLANPGTENNAVGDTVCLPVAATDTAGNGMVYSASNLPPGLSVDPNADVISGTPLAGDEANSPYNVTLTATDATNSAVYSTTSFAWEIGTGSPTTVSLTAMADQTNTDLDNASLQVSATDSAGNNLIYKASNLPPGLTIDPSTGLITGQIADGNIEEESYNVQITAQDSANADIGGTECFQWVVQQDNTQINNLQIQLAAAAGADIQGGNVQLPTGPTGQLFNVTFTGGGLRANQTVELPWNLYSVNGTTLTALIPQQTADITADANGNVNRTKQFTLFTNRDGSIEGVSMVRAGTSATIRVNGINGVTENNSPRQVVCQNDVTVQGHSWRANASTSTNVNSQDITLSITNLTTNGNGTVSNSNNPIPTIFNYSLNVTNAAPNTTLSNIWYSVIEPDFWKDDKLVYDAKIADIAIGNNGSGSITGSFILFGRRGDVAGPDEDSWENPTDPIYMLLQFVSVRSGVDTWWNGARSQTFVGRVAPS